MRQAALCLALVATFTIVGLVSTVRLSADDMTQCATANGGCGDPAFNRCSYDEVGTVVCSDINECMVNHGGCGDPAAMTCSNLQNAKNACIDVDECAAPAMNDCTADKPCVNIKGGYFCGCDFPTVFDRTTGSCRPGRVLVLDDTGGTTLLADLQAAGFAAADGGRYYWWDQSPDLSNFDTILWLEGKEHNYGKPLLPGIDQLIADFVAAGGGLVRTEWGIWSAATQRVLGNTVTNPASIGVTPVALPTVVRSKDAGSSWTVTNAASPLTRNLPATFAATGGYTVLALLPGSEAVATYTSHGQFAPLVSGSVMLVA